MDYELRDGIPGQDVESFKQDEWMEDEVGPHSSVSVLTSEGRRAALFDFRKEKLQHAFMDELIKLRYPK